MNFLRCSSVTIYQFVWHQGWGDGIPRIRNEPTYPYPTYPAGYVSHDVGYVDTAVEGEGHCFGGSIPGVFFQKITENFKRFPKTTNRQISQRGAQKIPYVCGLVRYISCFDIFKIMNYSASQAWSIRTYPAVSLGYVIISRIPLSYPAGYAVTPTLFGIDKKHPNPRCLFFRTRVQ